MTRDKADYVKGMCLTSDGPVVPITRPITKGAFLTSGPIVIKRAPIVKRIDELHARIAALVRS
jgi:hypothetical protein